jgi:hypothetical protein
VREPNSRFRASADGSAWQTTVLLRLRGDILSFFDTPEALEWHQSEKERRTRSGAAPTDPGPTLAAPTVRTNGSRTSFDEEFVGGAGDWLSFLGRLSSS